jgi:hypothetical protein
MNFTSKVTQQNGFLSVISTLSPRIQAYNSSLEGIEDTASKAYNTILGAATYNPETAASLESAIVGYMEDMSYYLNQQVGDRYIFAGTRYTEAPVISGEDMAALPTPPTETPPYLYTDPIVPAYDVDFDGTAPIDPHPEAYVKDSVKINTTKDLTYGVTSNEDGFQQIIMGLRFAYSALQDPTQYETYMETPEASSEGFPTLAPSTTGVTNSYNTLENTKENDQ